MPLLCTSAYEKKYSPLLSDLHCPGPNYDRMRATVLFANPDIFQPIENNDVSDYVTTGQIKSFVHFARKPRHGRTCVNTTAILYYDIPCLFFQSNVAALMRTFH